ncbi:hypothetical protein LGH70_19495 [Hymenobacter sp. BT635]|uniref:Uncharacterized protein n=1 Tax=Hymenobacter nitidus TaxID=2880929 RepID=A0ABS8AKL9_9BACT|nr:hypothetical protein [Hymenobacter nitidus]MCB2379790.1 hypothetical protein [Hymenobacter nitidus]
MAASNPIGITQPLMLQLQLLARQVFRPFNPANPENKVRTEEVLAYEEALIAALFTVTHANEILSGAGAPVASLGSLNDVYLNETTGDLSRKQATGWVYKFTMRGKDGKTPVKGKDYFDGEPGYTPIKGVDYRDGENGYTPIKGVDYQDGQNGADGNTINWQSYAPTNANPGRTGDAWYHLLSETQYALYECVGRPELSNGTDEFDIWRLRFTASAAPTGEVPVAGDAMLRSVYDPNNDGKISAALIEPTASRMFVEDTQIQSWDAREESAKKGQPGGYAGLDDNGKVPAEHLPGAVTGGDMMAATYDPDGDGKFSPGQIVTTAAARFVSDAERNTWNGKQGAAEKGQPNGYAALDATGKVPADQLPEATVGGDMLASTYDPDGDGKFAPAQILTSATARFVTDAEKASWNGKAPADVLSAMGYAASVTVDFATDNVRNLVLAGNLTISGTSNRGNARQKMIRIICDASSRTLAFPAGWDWLGEGAPAALPANKKGILSLYCFGPLESDVTAVFSLVK